MHDAPSYFTIPYKAPSGLMSLIAAMIEMPPEPESESYADLICTEQDKAIIFEIITTMSTESKLGLLMKKGYMHNLGAQINHVHPLKFLSSILMHDHLRVCLKDFFGDYFKRNGFMDGIGPSLTQEADKGLLGQYIDEFAKEVGAESSEILPFFEKRNWEGLVRFFL